MLAPQPQQPAVTEDALQWEHFEGASLRLALAPTQAEIRAPKKSDLARLFVEENDDGRQASNDKPRPPPALDHQKELVKLFHNFSSRHSHWQVFADFCELAATTFSNAVDLAQYEKREARYLQIVKGYQREELDNFAHGIALLTLALEDGFADVLGRTYHDLELHNKWAAQYFTPYDLCRMMAKMTIGDTADLQERIAARGFVTTQEPAVGSGAMVIALAQAMREAGINYQKHLHVTAIDVDAKCVHMAYLQFTLLHIPAIVIHGNTLSLEEYGRWYTPAHVWDGWNWKLRRQAAITGAHELFAAPTMEPAAMPVEPAPEQPPAEKPPGPREQLRLF